MDQSTRVLLAAVAAPFILLFLRLLTRPAAVAVRRYMPEGKLKRLLLS